MNTRRFGMIFKVFSFYIYNIACDQLLLDHLLYGESLCLLKPSVTRHWWFQWIMFKEQRR